MSETQASTCARRPARLTMNQAAPGRIHAQRGDQLGQGLGLGVARRAEGDLGASPP